MSEQEFTNNRSSYIQSLTKAPTNLPAVFSNHDSQIANGKYQFDIREKKAAFLPKVTLNQIVELFEQCVINNKAHMLVAVEGIVTADRKESQILEYKSLEFGNSKTFDQISDISKLYQRLNM